MPDTLTGAVAYESATDILGLLKELDIAQTLLAPVWDLHPLKNFIDNLSTPLSLPIAS